MNRRLKPRSAIWAFGILLSLAQIPPLFAGSKENQRLMNGVIGNFTGWIHDALRNGADINAQGSSGEVALHVAVRMHKPDMLKLLLALGADVNARDAAGTSALHWAIYHERIQMAKTLIDRHADVNAKNAKGVTPLHLAASHPAGRRYPKESTDKNRYVNTDLARLLLSKGAIVDVKAGPDLNEGTPLIVAVSAGHNKTAQVLLENGADPNAKNSRGFRVLDIAAASGDDQSVRLLLKYGANPEQAGADGYTPLFRAIYAGKAENVVALINGSANTKNLPDQYLDKLDRWRGEKGRTFAHIAAKDGGAAAIDFCISQFLLLGAFDDEGWTPLHVASFYGSTVVAARLLKAGVTVDRQQTGRDTPLIVAAESGQKKMVSLLLKKGADPNLKGGGGYTALHAAAKGSLLSSSFWRLGESEAERDERELKYESVIRFLLAAGADKTLRNGDKRTPYEEALHHKNSRAAKILKP